MSYIVATYSYGPDQEQTKHRPAHRTYLAQLVEQGKLAASGPFITDTDPGALLIFSVESIEEAEKLIAADPMYTGGAVLSYQLRKWNPVMGRVGTESSATDR